MNGPRTFLHGIRGECSDQRWPPYHDLNALTSQKWLVRTVSALCNRVYSMVKKSRKQLNRLVLMLTISLINTTAYFKLTTLSDTSRHRYVLRTISVTCHRQDSHIQSNGVQYPSSNIFLVWVYQTISSSSYSYHPLISDHDPVPPLHRLA